MDFIEPVFGNRCIQYMNGEEAKLRRQRYDYFMNSEFVSMYFPSFVEVNFKMWFRICVTDKRRQFKLHCKTQFSFFMLLSLIRTRIKDFELIRRVIKIKFIDKK